MPPILHSRRSFLLTCSLVPLASYLPFPVIEQKTINKRKASEIGEYAIGFASKGSDDGFDHAFVVWYYSDPEGNRTVRRCAGFYPVSDENTKAYDMILGITGRVLDDSKTKISRELTVLINKDVFDNAIAVENDYKNGQTYHLAFNDCTTFVRKVAASIPGLNLPNRVTHIYPSAFLAALYDDNNP
jgi:hypothetical protein